MGPLNSAAIDAAEQAAADVISLQEPLGPFRRPAGDLARRVRLLYPLFDDLRNAAAYSDDADQFLLAIRDALSGGAELLGSINDGSKIYQAMQGESFVKKFQEVNGQIDKALNKLGYNEVGISDEVLEQVQLVHAQFRRASASTDLLDRQLLVDLRSALKEKNSDPSTLQRISEKLQLKSTADMKKESVALHNMVISSGGDPDGSLVLISSVLKKLADSVATDASPSDSVHSKMSSLRNQAPIIPDEFRCPISLELMHDPVIISSGQTYERSHIQRWLDGGHKICPKTQQPLSNTLLTPNFVLKGLIAQWCEANGIDTPTVKTGPKDKRSAKVSDFDRSCMNLLMYRMANGNLEEQRAAAGEVRLLAKRSVNNRICIAEAGAIPLLVDLLSSPDARTQEHAVTALLNLSIHADNKRSIGTPSVIRKIVEVLKSGSMGARENAAATLFSLSIVGEYKVTIGDAGALPPLIALLQDGSPRGRKDAATAIFNLCIYQGNKVRAVKAGIVTHLMQLIEDPSNGTFDEVLGTLALLASYHEGRSAIALSKPLPTLLEIIRTGSVRNKENAATILWNLCAGDPEQARAARELGAEVVLAGMAEVGSDHAKRKVSSLLEIIGGAEGT